VAQVDRLPGGGSDPTLSWITGQWVDDRFDVDISGLAPGDYTVVAGMSDLTAGGRAPVTPGNADNTVSLGTLRVPLP
jgi:hypothetical protein